MFKIFIGFDEREAVVYHTCAQSIIDRSSHPVSFIPLALNCLNGLIGKRPDGSNDFVYSRFLVPFLCEYDGWALFIDGDMVLEADIADLFSLADPNYAAMVVKHDYKTKYRSKYLGNTNEDYPKKNWSSVVLWNCSHEANKKLTPDLVSSSSGKFLHRFEWLKEEQVGELPIEWNWLAMEYKKSTEAKLIHYTIGSPCFEEYADCDYSENWFAALSNLKSGLSG